MGEATAAPTADRVDVERQLLLDAIDTLELIGCTFKFCDGPTLEPVVMVTCCACATLANLRVALGRPPRRDDELTALEAIELRDAEYMARATRSRT